MKPGMSSFQIVILTFFGASAVAGILIFAFLVGSNSSASLGSVVVWGTFDESAFQTVLRQLSETDGRFRQVTYVQKNEDTYLSDITNALAGGGGPDLFIIRQDQTISEASKIVAIPYAQLSKDSFRNIWAEAAEPFMGPEGIVGVPFAVDPFVLYWNRDMLSTGGIAQPPQYWEDVYGITRSVTKKNDAGTIVKSGLAFGEYANIDHAKGILSMLIQQAGGKITQRDSSGTLLPSLTTRVGDTGQPGDNALRFYTQFANPASQDYSWNRALPDSRTAFAQGDLALYLGPASEEPLIRRLNPNLNFAIAQGVPQVKNASKTVDGGYAYAFAIPRASQNKSGASTAAFLLASADASRMLSLAFGLASARRDVLGEPAQGNDAVFNKLALLVRAWEDPNAEETERIFRDMIQSVTSGEARTLEALQRADQSMRQLITQ
jgi:ABC-type glycerol-3-phosphate transport system substrate-binding protein